MKPGIFPLYKNSAAAQVSLILPTYNDKGWIEKPGSVLFELATSQGKNDNGNITYNWQDRIKFSLGSNDINLLFEDITKPLVHQYQGTTKTLKFQPGTGKYEGTFMLHVNEGDKKVSVGISSGEMRSLAKLLEAALPRIIGWN